MKFALTLLCEHPTRKTGLSSLFLEFVSRSLKQFEEVEWIVYLSGDHDWGFAHERLELVRSFPGNEAMKKRLLTDLFRVGPDARRRGADCLVTVGFVPILTGGLPVAMHMLSLQHLAKNNEVGFLRSLYRGWAANTGLKKADLVVTNTEFAISQILEFRPETERKILQSYEGLQHEFYTPQSTPGEEQILKEKYGIASGYLYWCSNFYPYKQAEKLFDAYALLSKEEQDALPIVMVGGGGWGDGLERAMAHAEQLGISKNIEKLGWVEDEDLAMLYRHAKLFCLASREETFGRCVIESMACGAPCIVNDIPVMHEVTSGGALVVDFSDSEKVVSAIRSLMNDGELYRRLQERGIERARDFDFEILARERTEALLELCKRAGSSKEK